jgi:hypothetical protein
MIPSIFSTWRAIIQLYKVDATAQQRVKWSNDALYLSHQLLSYSIHGGVLDEIQRLNQWGNLWFNQEFVRS